LVEERERSLKKKRVVRRQTLFICIAAADQGKLWGGEHQNQKVVDERRKREGMF